MTTAAEALHQDTTTLPPDAWRVEVFRRPEFDDPEGEHARSAIRELGLASVESVRLGKGYLLSPGYTPDEALRIGRELLADPVLDEIRLTPPRELPADTPAGVHRVLVAPQAGVMDPVALTIERLLARTGHVPGGADATGRRAGKREPARVATFKAYELRGRISRAELELLGRRVLANEIIEQLLIDSEALKFERLGGEARGLPPAVPLVTADDAELERISKDGQLSLNLVEMRGVQAHFGELGRDPTVCELETLAQTWSEHCKHKTLTGIVEMDGERIDNLLKSTIFRATVELAKPWCVSVFHDNAGIVEFDRGWDVCFKVETHNHPSAIDPYGGAGTGIGGVIRDILGVGLGAKPIANTDAFFVGPLDLPPDELPKGCMHPRRILRGVAAGVRDYGNRMGIPTVSGGIWHHKRYVGNPLVYAGTVGLIPHSLAEKSVQPGDAIVVAGGRTGRDGIHGATFSSAELTEESEAISSAAVQIGDPITEKAVLDCQLVARDRGLYRAVTDCGAGGFSSAVGEMGEKCGADVELAGAPLKYAGLAAHEIWISEAQERMVFAVPPEHVDELLAVFAAEDVEATVLGSFTDTGRLIVRDRGTVVCDLSMQFLHDGAPRPVRRAEWSPPALPDPGCPAPTNRSHADVLLALLGAPNSNSREWLLRQYDHEVQGKSVVKPLVGERSDGPGDGAVIKPLAESDRGLAITCGANPEYGLLDPEAMALAAIDEALRNAVAVGADPARAALLDNFSWGNCDKPDRLGSIVLAARACYDAAIAYSVPFISGKDSLNNEYRVGEESVAIPPTLLISAIAPVPDVRRAMTMDAKVAGDALYLVGTTRAELGGSAYLAELGLAGGAVPRPDLELAPRVLAALHRAIAAGHVRACHDLSEGGLALAAAEMAFAGGRGLDIDLGEVPLQLAPGAEPGAEPGAHDADSVRLYSESCTRFLVEVAPEHVAAFEQSLLDLPLARIGEVRAERRLVLRGSDGAACVDLDLEPLRAAHTGGFAG